MRNRKLPAWLSAPLVVGAFGVLLWLERRRPLRRAVESKLKRDARNLAMAGISAIALKIAERPILDPLAAQVERRGWGLLKRWRMPLWLEGLYDRPALSLRRPCHLPSVARRAGRSHRRVAALAFDLADDTAALDPVSSLERPLAD